MGRKPAQSRPPLPQCYIQQGKDFYNPYLTVRSARGFFTASVPSNDIILTLQIGAVLSVQESSENWTRSAGQLPTALPPQSCQAARAWAAPSPLSYHFTFIYKIAGSQWKDSARSISFHFWRAPGRNVSLLSPHSLSCRELKRDGTREYCTKCNLWPLDEGHSH